MTCEDDSAYSFLCVAELFFLLEKFPPLPKAGAARYKTLVEGGFGGGLKKAVAKWWW